MTTSARLPQNPSRRSAVATICATAAGAALPSLALAQTKEVKVGFLLPLTGGFAESGQLIKSAIDMAIDEINGKGGIKSLGAKIVPVYGN